MSEASPLTSAPSLAPEDEARANIYGLLARLFHAAPDPQFLAALLDVEASGGGREENPASRAFVQAWSALIEASRSAFPAVLEAEHTVLYVGTGKCDVTPYLSNYVLQHESDTPLAELRDELSRLGIARRPGVPEYEDHVAALFEVMRYFIAVQRRDVVDQKAFFDRFIYRGGIGFCDATQKSERASYYKLVTALTREFLEIEQRAFSIS